MNHLDYSVLVLYLLGTLGIGFYFSRKNKSASDMFSASGEAPWWVAGLSSFMTMFSAGTFVVWGAVAYKYGLVAVSINITYGIAALLVGYFVAGKWNELGVSTPAEYVELRFGRTSLQIYTWALLIFRVLTTAVALYALAVVVAAVMPLDDDSIFVDQSTGNMSVTFLIALFGLIAVIYTVAGGLWAVLMTDVLQFVILKLSVLFIVVLFFFKIDDWSVLADSAPAGFFDLTSSSYTFFFLVGWCATQFFMIGAEWAFVQRSLSVKTSKDARKANYLFGVLYLVSPALWLAPPILYRMINPDLDPEQAYILAGQLVLPAGTVGLMVAAMFSATASMVSSQLNVFAGVLTNDVYKNIFRPMASTKNLVLVGRFLTALIGVLLVGIAIIVPQLGGAEKLVISLSSLLVGPLMAPLLWGLFVEKVDSKAVWVTALVCFTTGVLIKFGIGPLTSIFAGLEQITELLSQFSKQVDIFIGVILPLLTLTIIHVLSGKESSPGWIRLQAHISSNRKNDANTQEIPNKSQIVDTTPERIIALALLVCGVTIASLSLFQSGATLKLVSFGVGTLTISFLIWAIRIRNSKH